jgi:hypothetical protein
MEQQTQDVQTPASSDSVSGSTSFTRCRSRKRSGGRCRLRVQDPATGLCFRHAALARKTTAAPDDCTDLYDEIFAAGQPVLGTVEDINSMLSNVVTLVTRGSISTRRAAVITYAVSLILRSVLIMDTRDANTPPEIIFGAPRSDTSKHEPAASEQPNTPNTDVYAEASPQEKFEAAERYSRLRT